MFNHFQGNSCITTKSGLVSSLYTNTCPHMKVDKWFPRTHDMTAQGGSEDLIEDIHR